MIEKILGSEYWYYEPEQFGDDEEIGIYGMCERIICYANNLNGPFKYPEEVMRQMPDFGYLLFIDGTDLILLAEDDTVDVFQTSWMDKKSIEEDLGVTATKICVVGETNRHIGPYGTVYLCQEWTGDFNTEVVRIGIDKLDQQKIGECLTKIVCDPMITTWANILFHILGTLPKFK